MSERQKGRGLSRFLLARLMLPLFVLPTLTGCVRPAQVESNQLPVRRVVVYRNGVAYFERSGEVESDQVHFRLRKENVGDFLATLAVLERGGHTVRAASFPVSMEDLEDKDPELTEALDSWERKKSDSRELCVVTLELDGEQHDLTVGYLAETPLWRPSYRLVVGEKGEAIFQAWGIVQNQSGEDWVDVEIALVAGAPIAFESTLGEPVIPRRPIVTDRGEVISAVPEGETTLYQVESASADGADSAVTEEVMEDSDEEMGSGGYAMSADPMLGGVTRNRAMSRPKAKRASKAAASPPMPSMAPQSSANLARVELQTGATRYEVPHRVTIPDQSATMVLLVSKKVPGEAVYLFSPDGGVPGSYTHPFRVARFKNESGGMLERGPIAVFEKGAFLGQGIVESLPVHGRATVPFALMRSLSILKETSHDQRGSRLYAVREGRLTIERDEATIVEYKVTNGDAERARILLRHSVTSGAKLWEPPKGSEELSGEKAYLIPIDVPAFGKASLMVEERRPIQRNVDWQSVEARSAIRNYLKGPAAKAEERKTLETILQHAAQLSTMNDNEGVLIREQRELEKSTRETRLSIKAIEKNRQASALRRELTARLAAGAKRLETITRDLVELRLRRTEQEIRLKEAKSGFRISPPDRR